MNKRDFIYARQSRDKKDSVSIEAQIEACKKFADSNAEILFDKGFSGKNTDRPNMQHLIENVKSGNVKRIVVYKLDRISRNILDFANLLNLFNKYEVSFISTQEQLDTATPIGRAMIFIIMTFAQMERETIAQRIKDNYDFRAKTGQYFMGGNVPFGYDVERQIVNGKKASVIVVGKNAELLKKLYEMYFSGMTVSAIAKYLNSQGLLTSSGNPYSNVTVKRILLNMTQVAADQAMYDFLTSKGYVIGNEQEEFDGTHGIFLCGKKKNGDIPVEIQDMICVIGSHIPIIPSETYLKAYSSLVNDSVYKLTKRSQKSFLAGLIKCSECGYSIGLKSTKKNGKEYAYYFCRGKSSLGICDSKIWIQKDELERFILDDIKIYLSDIKHDENKIKIAENTDLKISEINKQIENLLTNLGKGNSVVDNLLTDKITQLSLEVDTLKAEKLKNNCDIKNSILAEFDDFDFMSVQDKTTLIRKIIGKIEIDKGENIKITYLI